jgi:hypothetical protein
MHFGEYNIYIYVGEHCEWETYQDWLGEGIPMLHQILVEVHGCPGDTALDFMDSFEKAGYLRYHKEPNIQGDPNCIELGMIKVRRSFSILSSTGVDFEFSSLSPDNPRRFLSFLDL